MGAWGIQLLYAVNQIVWRVYEVGSAMFVANAGVFCCLPSYAQGCCTPLTEIVLGRAVALCGSHRDVQSVQSI